MELVTQWTARRTYPEFLQSLGGRAAHQTTIKSDGLCYGKRVRNFDRLLSSLKVDEGAALREMRRLIDMVPRDAYGDSLTGWLAGKSGKPKEFIIEAVLSAAADTKSARFEYELRELGLIL